MRARVAGICVLLVGAGFVLAGLAMSQELDVFRKAVFICLECIGIG